MSDFDEIKGLVAKVNEALVPLRSEVDSLKASQRDVVTEAKFDKIFVFGCNKFKYFVQNQVLDALCTMRILCGLRGHITDCISVPE